MLLRNAGMPSGTAVGPSGKNYDVRNGFIDVTEPEDVEPLRALGFEIPDDGRPAAPRAPAPAATPAAPPDPVETAPVFNVEFSAPGSAVLEVVDDVTGEFGFEPLSEEADTPAAAAALDDEELQLVEPDESKRCQGTTKRGTRCRLPVIGETAYCHLHQPKGE